MVDYRLKHGNEKFMNDSEMFFKKNGRTLNAYGGVAGLLGERTGYKEGIGPRDRPMGPPFETDDPKKAVKEVIKRLIKLEGANIPISEKLSIALGPNLDQAEIRGVLDILVAS